jgi:hypothetical protein
MGKLVLNFFIVLLSDAMMSDNGKYSDASQSI